MKSKTFAWVGAIAVALAFAVTSSAALAKKRCTDGETPEIAKYTISKGEHLDVAINEPLTKQKGDPAKGIEWMVNRRQGNCIACHTVQRILDLAKPGDMKAVRKYGFHGEVGPPLDGVASRYTEGELRMLLVDAKKVFPQTIMPAFHKKDGFHRVLKDCQGLAILSAQRIEDIIAFLKTLK